MDDNALGDSGKDFYGIKPEPNGLYKNRTGAIYKFFHTLGFDEIDLADGDEMLCAMITEDDSPGTAALLKGSHVLPLSEGNASPVSHQRCCQIVARHIDLVVSNCII